MTGPAAASRRQALRERAAAERDEIARTWHALAPPIALADRLARGLDRAREHPALVVAAGIALGLAVRRMRRRVTRWWWLPTLASVLMRALASGARPRGPGEEGEGAFPDRRGARDDR